MRWKQLSSGAGTQKTAKGVSPIKTKSVEEAFIYGLLVHPNRDQIGVDHATDSLSLHHLQKEVEAFPRAARDWMQLCRARLPTVHSDPRPIQNA